MTKVQLGILSAILVAGSLVSWRIQHSARMQLRERAEALRQQGDLLALWSAENDTLSNLVARGRARPVLTNKQIRELLRLRNQAGQLKRADMAAGQLEAANQRLLAALARDATNENHWASEPLAFSTFADPESALKSTLWAWNAGDPAAYLASAPPEERAALETDWQNKSDSEIMADCKSASRLWAPATEGVCVLRNKAISENESVVDIYFEGDGKTRRFVLTKFGGDWKVTGLELIFN